MNGRTIPDFPYSPLTPREQEVLTCICSGQTNRQIAEQLTLTVSTVKWYVRQIYNKLGVETRVEAIARAERAGIVDVEAIKNKVRHNLPVGATLFVGREQELRSLAKLITDQYTRLITIVGPGGIGKTRLAVEAAGRQVGPQSIFTDGVFFVSLAPLATAVEIIPTLAATLGFHFGNNSDEKEQLFNYLRHKKMLLIIDNFEHLLNGRELLAEIIEEAPALKLLVTSRERLQLRSEQLFTLQGLTLLQDGNGELDIMAKGAGADYASAQLFLNIARRSLPDFDLLPGDVEQLNRICHLVGGMPLGLELAAAWVGVLSLADIADEIEQSWQLLSSQHHDSPQRHSSMQASLDASWKNLSVAQQHAFQALTLFQGGFTREAALLVANAPLPILVTLVNKSWLNYERQKDRYLIHEILRQYGAAKLNDDPIFTHKVCELHSTFFCAYLQKRELDWYGPRQKEAAAEIRNEIDNIQHAWRWAANEKKYDLLAQGLKSLYHFYYREGRMKDGAQACHLVTAALPDTLVKQVAEDGQHLALWSRILALQSDFVHGVAQKEKLLEQSEQFLEYAAQKGRDTRADQALFFLYKSYLAGVSDLEQAIYFANLGLEIYRGLGDIIGEMESLKVIGSSHLFHGDHVQAVVFLNDSLTLGKQLDDAQGIADTLAFLGMAARHVGDYEEAEAFFRKSIELYQQIGNRFDEKNKLVGLAVVLTWAGKFTAAKETVLGAIEIARDLGQYQDSWLLNALTVAALHFGQYSDAQAVATESLALAREKGYLLETGWALENLGEIVFVMGDIEQAKRYLQESVVVMEALSHVYRALAQAVLGYVLRAQGEIELACHSLLDPLRVGIELRSISPILISLPIAALLTADAGRPERAVELYGLSQRFGFIANSQWYQDVACIELNGVLDSLPSDVAATAVARGREMDLWATAELLLLELNGR